MAPRVLKQMSQTFTTIHSVTICLPSLRRYPNYAHPRSSTPLYLFTSLGRRTCHITDRIRMYMCEYDPVKYGLSRLTSDIAPLKFILVAKPVPYQLTMLSSRSFSLYRACHITDHFRLCLHMHNSFLQSLPAILYSHRQYTFVFDNIPSFYIPHIDECATSSSAQPPLRSEMHIHSLLHNLICS